MPKSCMAVTAALALGLVAADQAAAQAPGWTRADLKPVTQPAVVGNRVVLDVAAAGGLRVIALDAATGQTVWSRDATTSSMAPGQAPSLAFAGANVIFVAKGSNADDITAVDVETGTERWRFPGGHFAGSPSPCTDAPAVICVSGELAAIGSPTGQLRIDAATGKPLGLLSLGTAARDIGDALYDTGDRDPDRLVATNGLRLRWARPLAAIFRPGFSSDNGWNIARLDSLGLYVGSVGSAPRRRGGRDIYDLSREITVGFRIANGRTKWRRPGYFECATLPCP